MRVEGKDRRGQEREAEEGSGRCNGLGDIKVSEATEKIINYTRAQRHTTTQELASEPFAV